jgi:hypothetical protein
MSFAAYHTKLSETAALINGTSYLFALKLLKKAKAKGSTVFLAGNATWARWPDSGVMPYRPIRLW